MLKEACAISALVAAALVPSVAAHAAQGDDDVRPATTSVSLSECASRNAAKCKWLEENGKRCFYCKSKKGGYKKQYCEKTETKKPDEDAAEIDCKSTKETVTGQPDKFCRTCVNAKTGKIVSRECNS